MLVPRRNVSVRAAIAPSVTQGCSGKPGREPVVAEHDEVVSELLDAGAVLEHVVIGMPRVGPRGDRDVHTELHLRRLLGRFRRSTFYVVEPSSGYQIGGDRRCRVLASARCG